MQQCSNWRIFSWSKEELRHAIKIYSENLGKGQRILLPWMPHKQPFPIKVKNNIWNVPIREQPFYTRKPGCPTTPEPIPFFIALQLCRVWGHAVNKTCIHLFWMCLESPFYWSMVNMWAHAIVNKTIDWCNRWLYTCRTPTVEKCLRLVQGNKE